MAHEAPPAASAEGAAAAGPPKSKLPLIAAIVAGIAVGAGSGVVMVGPMFAKKFAAQAATAAADTTGGEAAAAEGAKEPAAGEHGEGAKGAAAAAPPILTLENLVLNPSGSNGSRYLLFTIALECKDAKAVEALTLRDPELRDVILTALSKKSVDDLSEFHRDDIKTELTAALNERFGKAMVKQVFLPQFVIQ